MSVKTALSKLKTAVAGYTTEADAFMTRMGKGQLDPDIIEETLNSATQKAIQDILAQIDGLDIAELTARSEIQRKLVGIQNAYDPNSKMAFEFFAPLYTVAETLSVGSVKVVAGDDSVDCATTATLVAGKEYIIEGTGGPVTVTVAEILSATRFRAASTATVSITGGTMKRTNWTQHNGYADVAPGKVYYAAPLNMDASVGGRKAIIIRSTGDESSFSLYFKDSTNTNWTAIPWTYKRVVISDPTSLDVEYAFAANGSFDLKIVSNVTATVKHMVVMSHVSGLGGTARAPETPTNLSPAAGATGLSETPTFSLSPYVHGAAVPFKSARIQVSLQSDFSSTVYDVAVTTGASLTLPAGKILANKTYYWRGQVQDTNNAWSEWSTPTSFSTMTTFAYVSTPINVTPGAGATDISNGLTLTTSAFSVVGTTGTHAASRYEIAADSSFSTLVYDSGEVVTSLTSLAVPGEPLAPSTTYFWRCRHKDAALGWSDWSATTRFVTGTMSYIEDVFSTYLYTGNGGTYEVNNGIDLAGEGGLVWTKARTSPVDRNHSLVDTVRGSGSDLNSSTNNAAISDININSFSSNGYRAIQYGSGVTNHLGSTYASWCFRRAPKFFTCVTVTKAAGSNATVDLSSLGTVGMVTVKRTDSTGDWYTWHRSLPAGQLMYLNQYTAASTLGHITVSGTTLTLVNGVIADGSYVVYAWAHDESPNGLIQCGSFMTDANGNATVNLGCEPQFLTVKVASDSSDWMMSDVFRGMPVQTAPSTPPVLRANMSAYESSGPWITYPTATGFVFKGGVSDTNIYLAIRRGPMRVPTDGSKVFKALTHTGTNAATTVTGVGFAPDMMFGNARDVNGSGFTWFDKLRGTSKVLTSYITTSENDSTLNYDLYGGFTNDGANLGFPKWTNINANGWPAIMEFFRRAPGFMDAVCDTGTGAAHAISHSLTVAPELIIRKSRSAATQWECWHSALAATEKLVLNSTAGKATDATAFGTLPTATQFYVGASSNTNASAATYVTYLFATCPGVSKVFSFTGNGTSLPIDCGFTSGARFVLIKRTDDASDWFIWDNARGIALGNDPHLSLNTTAAEVTTDDAIDPWSSGFIVKQNATTNVNVSGGKYIGLAIA